MSKLSGDGQITLATDVVAEMSSWSIDKSANTEDGTVFGSDWAKNTSGIKSWSGSASGYAADTDTAGQVAIEAAFDAGTVLSTIRFYQVYSDTPGDDVVYYTPDTSSDADAGIIVTGCSASKDQGAQLSSISFSFTGTGPLKKVSETVS